MEADRSPSSISAQDLRARLGTAAAPIVIDVRRAASFDADETMIAGSIRRAPEDVAFWAGELSRSRPAVLYCVHGHDVSQGAAAALRDAGLDVRYLEHGIAGWADLGLPRRRKIGAMPGRWVTRERPKVDRIACPWLIRRFIDPEAEILYAPADRVLAIAEETGGIPFDVPDVEFGHDGERCSFDAFLRRFELEGADPALDRLALIVRGADTGRLELTPQSPGLLAIAQGLSATHPDDHEMLASGMVLYDALYAWCRAQEQRRG